jgi:nucleoside-diphosphate-sugar epimerase
MALHLVTGGAGFIGSSITEALLAAGESVRILDDFSSGRRQNLESMAGRFELVEGSVVDFETVARAVRGVEAVFHEAAVPSVQRSVVDPRASMLAGVQGTTVVLDAARHAGVRRVVFAASSAVYGDDPTLPRVETLRPAPLSPYAVSKAAGEQLMRVAARLYGLETLSLRYFNVFGPRQDPNREYASAVPNFIMAAIANRRPVVFGDGEQTRDFCYVGNVVEANLLALSTPARLTGQVINIGSGERTSLNGLLKHIGELAGAPLDPEYRPTRAGDMRHSLADTTAARELIGYRPKVDLREGLRRTYEFFRRPAG